MLSDTVINELFKLFAPQEREIFRPKTIRAAGLAALNAYVRVQHELVSLTRENLIKDTHPHGRTSVDNPALQLIRLMRTHEETIRNRLREIAAPETLSVTLSEFMNSGKSRTK